MDGVDSDLLCRSERVSGTCDEIDLNELPCSLYERAYMT